MAQQSACEVPGVRRGFCCRDAGAAQVALRHPVQAVVFIAEPVRSRRRAAVDLRHAVCCVVPVLVDAGVVSHFGESAHGVVLVADRLAGLADAGDLASLCVADLRDLPFAVGDLVGSVARVVFDARLLLQSVGHANHPALAIVRVALDGHARFVDHAGGSSSRVVGEPCGVVQRVLGVGRLVEGVVALRAGVANAAGDQAITDERYPGFAVTLPAGVSITGWDGVKKTRITYDAAGRTTGVINEAGVTIESYTHDSQGRVTQVKDALNQTTSIEYDASNRPNRITDRKGQVTQVSYTERGQIAKIEQPGQTITYQYDAVGRLTEVRDNTSVNQYQYDAADRVTQIDSTTAAGSHRLGYEYDSLDRITKRNLSGTGISTAETTSYVEGNPLTYSDPLGLDKTVWRFPSGPTNGNWGGRCWSGGQYSCGDRGAGKLPPTDSADACYKNHDICYSTCSNPNDMACRAMCNKQLVNELKALPSDPRKWPLPPRSGTERDSANFRNRALGYFGSGE